MVRSLQVWKTTSCTSSRRRSSAGSSASIVAALPTPLRGSSTVAAESVVLDATGGVRAHLGLQPQSWSDIGMRVEVDGVIVRDILPAPYGGLAVEYADDLRENTIDVWLMAPPDGCWMATIEDDVFHECGSIPASVAGSGKRQRRVRANASRRVDLVPGRGVGRQHRPHGRAGLEPRVSAGILVGASGRLGHPIRPADRPGELLKLRGGRRRASYPLA